MLAGVIAMTAVQVLPVFGPMTAPRAKAAEDQGTLSIMLDPGHDNIHTGAAYGGLYEQNLTLRIARYCREALAPYNVNVYMTRDSESCPFSEAGYLGCLQSRPNAAVTNGCSALISIHINASAGRSNPYGTEVYYPNGNYRSGIGEKGRGLAQAIHSRLVALGLKDKGIHSKSLSSARYPDGSYVDSYSIIRNSKILNIPGIIVEHAYIKGDYGFLASEDNLRRLGQADAAGIIDYFGLKTKEEVEQERLNLFYQYVSDYLNEYGPTFDAVYYADRYPDLKAAFGYDQLALLNHFTTCGLSEGRQASPVFDINYYRTAYPDLIAAFGDDTAAYARHYAAYGQYEGRQALAPETPAEQETTEEQESEAAAETPVEMKVPAGVENPVMQEAPAPEPQENAVSADPPMESNE